MEFDIYVNCETCKYGYFADLSFYGEIFCGADVCSCEKKREGYCEEYEEGNIPDGKHRIW